MSGVSDLANRSGKELMARSHLQNPSGPEILAPKINIKLIVFFLHQCHGAVGHGEDLTVWPTCRSMERPRAAFWELHRKLGESFDAEMMALREELTSLKRLQTSLSEEHVTPIGPIDDAAIVRQKSPVSGDSFRSRLSPHGPPPPEEEIQFLESLGDVSPDTSNRWSSTSFADDLRVALGSRADVRRMVQSFYSNCFSIVSVVRAFGFFMGTLVVWNFLNVLTIFPAAILVNDCYIIPMLKCCCCCCCQDEGPGMGQEDSTASGTASERLQRQRKLLGDEPHFEFKLREFWHRAVDEEPLAEGPSGPGRKHSSSAQMVFPDSSKAIIEGSARESVLPFIQHPGSPLRAWWDVLGMTLLTFDIVVIPLRFFDPPETLVLVIMLFWNLDILVSFITGYYHKGILVLDLRRIAKHYATTWFPFDATVVGIDWLLYGLEGRNQTAGVARLSKTVRILRFLRLVRLARLAKVSTMVEALQEQINSQVATIHYSIFKIIGRMMLLNHVIACSWWGIAQLDEGQPNWITENQLEGRSIEYQYSTALHWSLTQLGVGQTNIEAVNFAERLFSIFITFCALITFSTLVSSVTSLMASLQRLKNEEIEQFRSLRRFLVQNEIPADLGHRVTRFLQYTYALRHEALSLDVHLPILNLLSKPLQAELQLARYRECLRECAFFDRLLQHDSFHVVRVLREVATGCLSHAVLAAGDVAFAAGAVASSAYFLAGGAFCYSREGVRSSVPCQKWVAEMCLWTPWLHVGDLVSEEVSRVIALEVTNFCECVGKVLESKMLGAAYAEEYVANLNSQLQWSDIWFYDADRSEKAATAVSTRPVPRPRCCGTSRRRKPNRVNPIVPAVALG
ncbi:Potassium/sodium hyperpolarization-activated cyclic nucleotide-gated channel 1 [Symbiodinium microadriaticum]|uniref:Potassium/sodium hyperpolarization-activated cyclic nucleotide-gated channel 1 n=1 Tax=Symbiodinium microadriaticum TaxID=2951 RepID=A0A1Q9DFP4_SYMMI|nr:Potassium/sodium hyperpolarization-activated cyclic nucleotide-gated channel 1 [Symbiodinium microadriaticum]